MSALLVVAMASGMARLAAGLSEPVGTLVNMVWAVFDLVVMSIMVRAVTCKGFVPEEGNADGV